jgi:hypothetical protein
MNYNNSGDDRKIIKNPYAFEDETIFYTLKVFNETELACGSGFMDFVNSARDKIPGLADFSKHTDEKTVKIVIEIREIYEAVKRFLNETMGGFSVRDLFGKQALLAIKGAIKLLMAGAQVASGVVGTIASSGFGGDVIPNFIFLCLESMSFGLENLILMIDSAVESFPQIGNLIQSEGSLDEFIPEVENKLKNSVGPSFGLGSIQAMFVGFADIVGKFISVNIPDDSGIVASIFGTIASAIRFIAENIEAPLRFLMQKIIYIFELVSKAIDWILDKTRVKKVFVFIMEQFDKIPESIRSRLPEIVRNAITYFHEKVDQIIDALVLTFRAIYVATYMLAFGKEPEIPDEELEEEARKALEKVEIPEEDAVGKGLCFSGQIIDPELREVMEECKLSSWNTEKYDPRLDSETANLSVMKHLNKKSSQDFLLTQ